MPNFNIETLGGNCPVQADGTIDDRIWYFRARGEKWRFQVWGDGVTWLNDIHHLPLVDPVFCYSSGYQSPGAVDPEIAAGWMSEAEATLLIEEAVASYESWKKGLAPAFPFHCKRCNKMLTGDKPIYGCVGCEL